MFTDIPLEMSGAAAAETLMFLVGTVALLWTFLTGLRA